MSSLFAVGGVWYLKIQKNGVWVRRSTRIRVKNDPRGQLAKQVQRDYDTRQARAKAGLEDPSMTVRSALEKTLSKLSQATPAWIAQSRGRAEKWIDWLSCRGITQIARVTADDIQAWIDERTQARSAKTVLIEVGLLKAAAKIANRTLKHRPVPVDSWPTVERVVPVKPETIGAYSPNEIRAIVEYFGENPRRKAWQTAIYLLASLGCRWSELERARVGDVDLEANPPRIRFRNAKPKNPQHLYRTVPLLPDVAGIVAGLVAGKKFGDALVAMPGKFNVTDIMHRCCARLGIQYRRIHGLRHSFITQALERGVPFAIVQYWVGHQKPGTTMRYTHMSGEYGEYSARMPSVPAPK